MVKTIHRVYGMLYICITIQGESPSMPSSFFPLIMNYLVLVIYKYT